MIEYRWPLYIAPQSSSFRIQTRNIAASSPFRANVQTTGSIAKNWVADIAFGIKDENEWPEMMAVLSRVEGGENLIRMPCFARPLPFGVAAGKSKLSTTTQQAFSDGTLFSDGTGWTENSSLGFLSQNALIGQDTVLISGLVPNQTKSIEFSDLMEIDGFLYKSQVRASSDATGKSRVVITPPLRTNVYSGAPVLFEYPTSPFQVLEDVSPTLSQGGGYGDVPIPFLDPVNLKLLEFIP
jgi:hypothetical protein